VLRLLVVEDDRDLNRLDMQSTELLTAKTDSFLVKPNPMTPLF